VPPASLVELRILHKESNSNHHTINKDSDYKNNNINGNGSNSPFSQREESNDNNYEINNDAKPIAKLIVVDDDTDIVQVLKLGLLKNRFIVNAFTSPAEALQNFKCNAESYTV